MRAAARTAATTESWRRVSGDEPAAPAPTEPGEQWRRVFGPEGPGRDVTPGPRRPALGGLAFGLGVATPLLALILNPIGILVLLLGGLATAIASGSELSAAGEGRRPPSTDVLAVSALVLGISWVVAGLVLLIART